MIIPVKAIRKISWILFGVLLLAFNACRKKATIETLLSADPDIRAEALQYFSKETEKERLPLADPLMMALHDEDFLVAQRAIDALKIIGPAVVDRVKTALNDQDPLIRASAIDILTIYAASDTSLISLLENMTKDTHPLVKDEATFALHHLKTS